MTKNVKSQPGVVNSLNDTLARYNELEERNRKLNIDRSIKVQREIYFKEQQYWDQVYAEADKVSDTRESKVGATDLDGHQASGSQKGGSSVSLGQSQDSTPVSKEYLALRKQIATIENEEERKLLTEVVEELGSSRVAGIHQSARQMAQTMAHSRPAPTAPQLQSQPQLHAGQAPAQAQNQLQPVHTAVGQTSPTPTPASAKAKTDEDDEVKGHEQLPYDNFGGVQIQRESEAWFVLGGFLLYCEENKTKLHTKTLIKHSECFVGSASKQVKPRPQAIRRADEDQLLSKNKYTMTYTVAKQYTARIEGALKNLDSKVFALAVSR